MAGVSGGATFTRNVIVAAIRNGTPITTISATRANCPTARRLRVGQRERPRTARSTIGRNARRMSESRPFSSVSSAIAPYATTASWSTVMPANRPVISRAYASPSPTPTAAPATHVVSAACDLGFAPSPFRRRHHRHPAAANSRIGPSAYAASSA